MHTTTPVRSLGTLDTHGCRVLSDAGIAYADGAESALAEIVGRADDLASTSQELADEAYDWATEYSLTPVRANLLRSLELPADARVLEIGAGCGPITRYLGETCALVDSVEPMAARARVARLRTRDLPNVAVHVGLLEDVPLEPTYDLVVVVGVLEYVANGSPDPTPYLDFLGRIHTLLRPGGSLVLAIENKIGAKYLAGAPEDHSDRPYDSVEDYPVGAPARTFTRERLVEMLTGTGFAPRVLGAFPDYKLPRVLVDDALFGYDDALAARIPPFPSRDYLTQRVSLVSERSLWSGLVQAGLGPHVANSFVVVAGRDAASTLWPDTRLATSFSGGRRPEYTLRTVLERSGDEVVFQRSRVVAAPDGADDVRDGALRHVVGSQVPHVRGVTLVDAIATDRSQAGPLLRRWIDLVPEGDEAPVDLVPHNTLLQADGSLTVIDQEWFVRGYDRHSHLVRGLFWTALELARTASVSRTSPEATIREMLLELADAAGVTVTPDDLTAFTRLEGAFQGVVNTTDRSAERRTERATAELAALLDTRVANFSERGDVLEELARLRAGVARAGELDAEVQRLRAALVVQDAELARLRSTRDARPTGGPRGVAGRVARRLHLR